MASLLRMPEVAASATEAILQGWGVAEGGTYATRDTLATVETEKALVDVEAESDGTMVRYLVAAGSTVEVGTPIALIAAPGENLGDIDGVLAELGVSAAPAPTPVVAVVPVAASSTEPAHPLVSPFEHQPTWAVDLASAAVAADTDGGRVFASPLARRLAREAGLDFTQLRGTGPGGRIVRRDVEAALAAAAARPVAPVASPFTSPVAAPTQPGTAFEDVPHSRMRRAIASRLTQSKQNVPHFYLRATCRVDALLAARSDLNAVSQVRISVNDFIVKAVARAHVMVPDMNVIWTDDAIRKFSTVDVAIAVATERGLVTPVLRGVEALTIGQVAAQAKDFAARARAGQLRQDELEGGSISVSNLGMFGTEEFAAIINPPQAAIVAIGAARKEPVVVDNEVRVGTVMTATVSVDHRSVDGALAAEWLAAFKALIENPIQILA